MGYTQSTISTCPGPQINSFTVNGSPTLGPPYQQVHVGQDIIVAYDLVCADNFVITVTDPSCNVVQSVSSTPNTAGKEAIGSFSYTTKVSGDYVVSLSIQSNGPHPGSQAYTTKVTAIQSVSLAQDPSSNVWAWIIIIIIVLLLIWLFWRSTQEHQAYESQSYESQSSYY